MAFPLGEEKPVGGIKNDHSGKNFLQRIVNGETCIQAIKEEAQKIACVEGSGAGDFLQI
jgi:hypothetical protein